jgi:hypothetical protein
MSTKGIEMRIEGAKRVLAYLIDSYRQRAKAQGGVDSG